MHGASRICNCQLVESHRMLKDFPVIIGNKTNNYSSHLKWWMSWWCIHATVETMKQSSPQKQIQACCVIYVYPSSQRKFFNPILNVKRSWIEMMIMYVPDVIEYEVVQIHSCSQYHDVSSKQIIPAFETFFLPSGKLTWQWNIPNFNRKYIFNPGAFSSQLC